MSTIHAGRFLRLAAVLLMTANVNAADMKVLERVEFPAIAGWRDDDHGSALAAFRRSCAEIIAEGRAFGRPVRFGGSRSEWVAVCRAAAHAADSRRFAHDCWQQECHRVPAARELVLLTDCYPEHRWVHSELSGGR